jgi:hypothetical protein
MKHILTLSIFILVSLASRSQNFSFVLNFEDSTAISQYFYTDSLLDSAGIWQIGAPNKPIFNSAYSPPNAVVTMLDYSLPPNVNASFIISVPDTVYYPVASLFTFVHKFDFVSAHGGGYVEYSVDSGTHWHPVCTNCTEGGWYSYEGYTGLCITSWLGMQTLIDGQYIFPPAWWGYVPTDTTPQGIPYFTGTGTTWIHDTIAIPSFVPVKTNLNTHLLFRFTAFTDSSTQTAYQAGWIIDNIGFTQYAMHCLGGINEINSSHLKVYPDPVTDGFTLSLTDIGVHDYSLSIIDLTGRELLYREEQEPEVTLNRGDIAAGSYIIKVTDRQTGNMMEKRVVFE